MLGAIAGDIIGSPYEWNSTRTTDFPLFTEESRFTDDSVLTCAVAEAIMIGRSSGAETDYRSSLLKFAQHHPRAGYGGSFRAWFNSDDPQPYGSFGNGSAMRVSPVGFAFDDIETVLREAERSAAPSHNHPEGIKGAQSIALGVFLARTGRTKSEIRSELERRFAYDLSRSLAKIRPNYHFDVTCQGSVPEAIIAFLEADDFESAVRNAVSLGGDADTQACIAAVLAEAYYGGVPHSIVVEVDRRLPDDLKEIVHRFTALVSRERS